MNQEKKGLHGVIFFTSLFALVCLGFQIYLSEPHCNSVRGEGCSKGIIKACGLAPSLKLVFPLGSTACDWATSTTISAFIYLIIVFAFLGIVCFKHKFNNIDNKIEKGRKLFRVVFVGTVLQMVYNLWKGRREWIVSKVQGIYAPELYLCNFALIICIGYFVRIIKRNVWPEVQKKEVSQKESSPVKFVPLEVE